MESQYLHRYDGTDDAYQSDQNNGMHDCAVALQDCIQLEYWEKNVKGISLNKQHVEELFSSYKAILSKYNFTSDLI